MEAERIEFIHRSWPADSAQLAVIRHELEVSAGAAKGPAARPQAWRKGTPPAADARR